MGEIASMMLDGELCEACGVYLDGYAPGFPRYCSEVCAKSRNAIDRCQVVKGIYV